MALRMRSMICLPLAASPVALFFLLVCMLSLPHDAICASRNEHSPALVSPAEFLGFEIGKDRCLADYEETRKYFELLDEASPWIMVRKIGTSTLGRPMIAVILSTPENLEKLDRYIEISRRLSDPRRLSEEEARALISEAKIISMITASIHASEVGAVQMAIELAYDVAAGKNERLAKALEETILFIVPMNPDGQQMVVDWYEKWLGTEFEGCPMPWLYHHYAGHDNNRDWFMMNLAETRAVVDLFFRSAVPQAVLDMHQMWSSGARLFLPPYYPPANENVDPMLYREINLMGSAMQLTCEERGMSGVISNAYFDAYWEGSSNSLAWWHHQIGLLSEAASVSVASPIYIEPGELQGSEAGFPKYRMLINFPNPWPGGWWRLRDIIDYDRAAAESFLECCAKNRERFLANYYMMGRRAVERGSKEPPFAYIIPSPQRDPVTAARLAEALMLGGVEIHRATKDFTVGRKLYREGSLVVRLDQPYGRYAKDLLEVQRYPDTRSSPKEPFEKPYDVTAWTLSLQMGVECEEIVEPFECDLELLSDFPYPTGRFEQGSWGCALGAEINASYKAVNELLAKGFPVLRLDEDGSLPRGTFLLPARKNLETIASEIASRMHLEFIPIDNEPQGTKHELRPGKTALFKPWLASMDEGWTRLLFDTFSVPYENVSNEDIQKGRLGRFDVLVIPNIRPSVIKDGKPEDEESRWFRPMPPEYSGGIGKEGIENIKKFVESGGTLVCLGSSCAFAIETFSLPVRNALEKLSSDEFYCPGSILKVSFKQGHPVTYGMPEKGDIFFSHGQAFATSIPYGKIDRTVLASYTDEQPLASGLLIGPERLHRLAALVEYRVDRGKVLLFGFNPQNRCQTAGTYKLLLNAVIEGARGKK